MARTGARLGQHFLKHAWAAAKLAHAVMPLPGETILEIGPGKGVLTAELLTLGDVVAVEKDSELVAVLNERFAGEIAAGRLRIIEADVRDTVIEQVKMARDARRGEAAREPYSSTVSAMLRLRNDADGVILGGGYILAANIPYYITGEIIRQFLSAERQPRAMALLIQKEVAQRITGGKESILSLSVKAYGTPKILAKVSRTHFSPPPSVDSSILAITDISKQFFVDINEEDFFSLVHAGFSSKRKFLSSNLSVRYDKSAVAQAFEAIGIPQKARAEDVSIENWRALTQALRHKLLR